MNEPDAPPAPGGTLTITKTALITGTTGQDGAYLAELLREGYRVVGAELRAGNRNRERLDETGITEAREFVDFDPADSGNIVRVLGRIEPDEVQDLAAQSFVALSFELPTMTGDVTGIGVTRIPEAIRAVNPGIHFYQASSSEMFGKVQEVPQSEPTPFHPRRPEWEAKVNGHWIALNYREAFGLHASSGIPFNHESPLRGPEFVPRKISLTAARTHHGQQHRLRLGNLDAKRDWGYARDYVAGMHAMLQRDEPGDLVLATGETHSVGRFVEPAFGAAGLTWQDHLVIDPAFLRPPEVDLLIGDANKAKAEPGWCPRPPSGSW